MESDYLYYTRRAAEEDRRAQRAITPAAREWHRQLATAFATRAVPRALDRTPVR